MSEKTTLRKQKNRKRQEVIGEQRETAIEDPDQTSNVNTGEDGHKVAKMSKYAEELKSFIRDEIRDLKNKFCNDLVIFKGEIKGEINSLQVEIDRECSENQKELQAQAISMKDVQTCMAKVEEWQANSGALLWEVTEGVRKLQERQI